MSEEESFNFDTYKKSQVDYTTVVDDINSKGKFKKDDRLFEYRLDQAGNELVILRFLPATTKSGLPIIARHKHNFKNSETGKWYIEFCPTTMGWDHKCPVCEDNNGWWDENGERMKTYGPSVCKETGQARARKKEYISNIYVIKDTNTPANNGKNFIWVYSQPVFEMINKVLKLSEQEKEIGKKPIPVFDMFNGANFILNLHKKDKHVSYTKCEWMSPTPFLDGNEEKMKEVWGKIYDLSEFAPEKICKSYDDLKKRLTFVITGVQSQASAPTPIPASNPSTPTASQQAPVEVSSSHEKEIPTADVVFDDNYFNDMK